MRVITKKIRMLEVFATWLGDLGKGDSGERGLVYKAMARTSRGAPGHWVVGDDLDAFGLCNATSLWGRTIDYTYVIIGKRKYDKKNDEQGSRAVSKTAGGGCL